MPGLGGAGGRLVEMRHVEHDTKMDDWISISR